jgi:hypothetical protein
MGGGGSSRSSYKNKVIHGLGFNWKNYVKIYCYPIGFSAFSATEYTTQRLYKPKDRYYLPMNPCTNALTVTAYRCSVIHRSIEVPFNKIYLVIYSEDDVLKTRHILRLENHYMLLKCSIVEERETGRVYLTDFSFVFFD